MTAVDRPDNGQDEGASNWADAFQQGITEGLRRATVGDLLDELWRRDPTLVASARTGAGEQRREKIVGLLCRFDWGTDRPNSEWRPVYERRAAELLALLGGPQPDGEARQHRMDADCWCQPVQADNGAWDHQ